MLLLGREAWAFTLQICNLTQAYFFDISPSVKLFQRIKSKPFSGGLKNFLQDMIGGLHDDLVLNTLPDLDKASIRKWVDRIRPQCAEIGPVNRDMKYDMKAQLPDPDISPILGKFRNPYQHRSMIIGKFNVFELTKEDAHKNIR